MCLGNLGETMKKIILLFLTAFFLFAYGEAFACGEVEQEKIDELKQFVAKYLPSFEGWCSKEKAFNFIDLVMETNPKTCVEIGVFGGSSLFPVASALKLLDQDGIVIGIDPWDKIECIKYFDPVKDEVDLKWWGNLNLDRIYYSYTNLIRRFNLQDYCLTIRATSENAVSEIDEIDILYIDGNHSEEVTKLDVELYLPKVRSGGYIWMNDAQWESRQEGLDLLLEACDAAKLIENGNCILFKKR